MKIGDIVQIVDSTYKKYGEIVSIEGQQASVDISKYCVYCPNIGHVITTHKMDSLRLSNLSEAIAARVEYQLNKNKSYK